jgi:hypothetical protein
VCASARDVHRRHCDGSGLHHLIPLFLVIGVVGLVVARRTVGGHRATLCALSQQVLRPHLLRMDRYALGHWTVTALSLGGRPVSWNVPNRARPIVMDSSRRAVLGVTARDGQIAVPLDAELGFDRESCGSLPVIHEPRDSV